MKSNIVIYSEQLAEEDIQILLQAIRDCEQTYFKYKELGIAILVPTLSLERCQKILSSIKPGFAHIEAFGMSYFAPGKGGGSHLRLASKKS